MKWHSLTRFSTLVLAATVALGVGPQAIASGIDTQFDHLMGNPMAGPTDVDGRQGAIYERLRAAMEAGRITDDNLHSIREQLQKIEAQEAGYKAKNGELSYFQTYQLQNDLDRISKELEADLTERKGGPVDVFALRNQIAARMSAALAAKRLTQAEYDQFSSALTVADKMIEASKGPDGLLATNDQLRIALQLDNLSQRFTAGEHQRKADLSAIDKRKDELRTLMRGGVAEGKLTEDEIDDLRQQLYTWEEKENRMANMGRPLTSDEQLKLALELEQFGAEIRARMDNGTNAKITDRTIDHRKAALDQTFANALFAGDISVAEATDFKTNLDKISADEANLRGQEGGRLTPDQTRDLLITVERLKGRFSRLTYNREKPWGGVDGLVNDIKQKIAVATNDTRLSTQESDDLQSKIADVLVAKSNERNTQGFVTTDSALKLAGEITALSADVAKAISDRTITTLPALQRRQKAVNHSIADGIDSGKITATEAGPLLAQYNKVAAEAAKLNAVGGTPDASALSAVVADQASLLKAIAIAKQDDGLPLESIDQVKAEVDREIRARTYNGKLTPLEVKTFRSEYDRLAELEKNSRAKSTGLDAANAMAIRDDWNKLLKTTKDTKHTAASP